MIQNLSETEFHNIIKFVFNLTTLKTSDLLRESGDVVHMTKVYKSTEV